MVRIVLPAGPAVETGVAAPAGTHGVEARGRQEPASGLKARRAWTEPAPPCGCRWGSVGAEMGRYRHPALMLGWVRAGSPRGEQRWDWRGWCDRSWAETREVFGRRGG